MKKTMILGIVFCCILFFSSYGFCDTIFLDLDDTGYVYQHYQVIPYQSPSKSVYPNSDIKTFYSYVRNPPGGWEYMDEYQGIIKFDSSILNSLGISTSDINSATLRLTHKNSITIPYNLELYESSREISGITTNDYNSRTGSALNIIVGTLVAGNVWETDVTSSIEIGDIIAGFVLEFDPPGNDANSGEAWFYGIGSSDPPELIIDFTNPIPEPGSLILLAAGIINLIWKKMHT
ncbi:MAG: hypothetical protein ACTSVV_02275 [Promethearchaeota archaeon]